MSERVMREVWELLKGTAVSADCSPTAWCETHRQERTVEQFALELACNVGEAWDIIARHMEPRIDE